MNEQELKDLVAAEVAAAVPAPAAEPVEAAPEAPAAKSYSQDEVAVLVKSAAKAAAEQAAKIAQRPAYGAKAPAVLRPRGEAKPLYWATKAALATNGAVVLRDVDGGVRFTAGTEGEGDNEGAAKAFRSYAERANADIEGDVLYAAKAMSTTSGSTAGEHFIERGNTRPVIDALYQSVVSRSLNGVEIYPMPSLICDAPTMGTFTAGWSAENANTTAAGDATTGRKTLTAKNLTGWGELSNQLLRDSNPGVEAYVRGGLAAAMGEAHDLGAFAGDGTSNAPVGLLNESGPVSTAISSDDIYTAIAKAVGRLLVNKIPYNNIVVVMRPEVVVKALITRAGASGDFLSAQAPMGAMLGGSQFAGPLSAKLGLPVYMTTAITNTTNSSPILVLHAPSWTIGDRQELEIASSNVAGDSFRKNQTYIRAIMRVDFNLKRATGLEIITGVAH